MKKKVSIIFCICVLFLLGLLLTTAPAGGPKEPEMVINLDVCPKAKVTNIIAYKGKWANQPAIWIQAKIQNVAAEPLQLKTRCSSDTANITRGFWIPKVGKPPIKPGKIGTAKYPFPGNQIPKDLTIVVQNMPIIE
jgi:hypothetical protein